VTAASGGVVDFHVDVCDAGAVRSALHEARPEGVYHLAGLAYVPAAERDTDLVDAVNRGGTANVLDAAHEVGARTLVVSSGAVYGRVAEADLPVGEDAPLRPVGAYAESKAAAEAECARRVGRQHVVVVRPFNHTGPGQAREFVCSDFAAQVAECELGLRAAHVEVGDLRSERDFSDVRDVVRAYVAALEHGRSGAAYNVCSGRATSVAAILETLGALARVTFEVRVQGERLRAGEVTRFCGDAAKLRSAAGWSPSIALRTTLADLLDDWRRRLADSAGGA
jgi:GDP-4-dehydro-6-deoxy-D-mannose reductase